MRGHDALVAFAEQERSRCVRAAERLRAAGLPCPVVSTGSTPTALSAHSAAGVTEIRAGVYAFHDLVMAGLGVCRTDDIALSVLTTVIGHQVDKGWVLVDAGWMALSRDRAARRASRSTRGTVSSAAKTAACSTTGSSAPRTRNTASSRSAMAPPPPT